MPPADERAIRTILVLGAGIIGLSAAIAFARALPNTRVTLVDVPPDPAALADRMLGSLPPIGRFHAAIGLNEMDLVRGGVATHRLGTRFEHWSADDEPWYHIFGTYGRPAGAVAFHQLWARERRTGAALPYHCYATAAALAEAGKFVHPAVDSQSLLSSYLYALRLDPDRYRERLARQCEKLPRVQGEIGAAERAEDGSVSALLLSDGRRLEADLFIDCAGPSAPLLSALDERFEDWGECLPCDRLLLGSGPQLGGPVSSDLAAATTAGWRFAFPLPQRVIVGHAHASAITSEVSARRVLASEAGVESAEMVAIRPGRRPEPWLRNVLAIGDAAVALDPLEWTNLHLAQSGILRALELLPGRNCHPLELREYNRRTGQETARVRDFLALHYLRSGRSKGEFWQSMAARDVPASLAHVLELFEARGRLPFYEEETFDKHSWLAVLLGMGVMPRYADMAAAGVDSDQGAAAMRSLAEDIAALPARLPAYRDYLARMTTAPARQGR